MSADSRLPLRTGIVTALKADATLTAIVPAARIRTKARSNILKPFVEVGAIRGSLFDAKTGLQGFQGIVEIDVYSDRRGTNGGVEQIQAAIEGVLDGGSNVTVAGHQLVFLHTDFADSFEEPDGETYRGVQRFRFVTASTS